MTAGLEDGGAGSCNQDTGGPLVTRATGVDSGYSLVGELLGRSCGKYDNYDIYTEVAHYLPWIADHFDPSTAEPSRRRTKFKKKNNKKRKQKNKIKMQKSRKTPTFS